MLFSLLLSPVMDTHIRRHIGNEYIKTEEDASRRNSRANDKHGTHDGHSPQIGPGKESKKEKKKRKRKIRNAGYKTGRVLKRAGNQNQELCHRRDSVTFWTQQWQQRIHTYMQTRKGTPSPADESPCQETQARDSGLMNLASGSHRRLCGLFCL